MQDSISSLVTDENILYLNLLLQVTFVSLASLLCASRIQNNAALRYALLYSSLCSLIFLCGMSLIFQSKGTNVLNLPIEFPAAYLGQFLLGINSPLNALPELVAPIQEQFLGVEGGLDGKSGQFMSDFEFPLFMILQIIWLSGLFVFTIGMIRSLHNADRIARRSVKLSAKEYRLFNSIASESWASTSSVHCRKSREIVTPVLIGITTPVLVVPEDFFKCFSEPAVRAILRHELAHVFRKDPIFNFLQKLILSIFWFHPLVHRMDKMISRAREEICDNYVLSKEQAADYGEVLLQLNLNQTSKFPNRESATHANIVLGITGGDWNLEQRIIGLLNKNREILMHLSKKSKLLLNFSVLAFAFSVSACQVIAQDGRVGQIGVDGREEVVTGADQDELRPVLGSPSATGANLTLGPDVLGIISEIQALMLGDENVEPNMEGAKDLLDELRDERYEGMNDFEKLTLLNFYTNYYLSLQDYVEATNTFEQMLTLGNIRQDIQWRALRSLGQLHSALENWNASIEYYEQWQAESGKTDHVTLQGLSYAHYQLEQFDAALTYWQSFMDMPSEDRGEITRENYAYLNGLYFTLEQWEDALKTTQEMVLLYNEPTDWENLRAIYRKLDERNAATPDAGAV